LSSGWFWRTCPADFLQVADGANGADRIVVGELDLHDARIGQRRCDLVLAHLHENVLGLEVLGQDVDFEAELALKIHERLVVALYGRRSSYP
jgi:hypothetical protein